MPSRKKNQPTVHDRHKESMAMMIAIHDDVHGLKQGLHDMSQTLQETSERLDAAIAKAEANTSVLNSINDAVGGLKDGMADLNETIAELREQIENGGNTEEALQAVEDKAELLGNKLDEQSALAESILANTGTGGNGPGNPPDPVEA